MVIQLAQIPSLIDKGIGIPVDKVSSDESDKLLKMEDKLHQRIIGQDEAVKAISRAIRRARVVYDINGREVEEVEPILDALPKLEQYIYYSSVGVYLKSDMLPHVEVDAVDLKSRHKGKLETENLLQSRDVNLTLIRPVYIYGPLNYNPFEMVRDG
ncbi:hypothetical protein IFM89_022913 [Coptis chinensis]|uniref:Uncharacterized protein n=1 Tax=Coptis chinensis TaxID=261450 RepID=A0A835IQA6_9MAGN|nr:hypothetical protein IFM89_022913 [Coptis chinensis]